MSSHSVGEDIAVESCAKRYLVTAAGVVPLAKDLNAEKCEEAIIWDVPLCEQKKRRKKKKKKTSLYDLYQKDSDEDSAHSLDEFDLDEAATMMPSLPNNSSYPPPPQNTFGVTTFEIGMDINVLLNQVNHNLIRSLCIDDFEGSSTVSRFGDSELMCLAASLRHNNSLLSLQLRYLQVTDVSLLPLCAALEAHPSLRAVDLSGTASGTLKVGEALRRLACKNTSILHLMLDDTLVCDKDRAFIEEAVQYNALMCADPRSNPFDVKMITRITEMEREQKLLEKQLSYNPWLDGPPASSVLFGRSVDDGQGATSHLVGDKKKHKKNVGFAKDSGAFMAQEICGEYMRGSCRYGSRCKYFHPPRSDTLSQVVHLQDFREEETRRRQESNVGSSKSSCTGRAPSEFDDRGSYRWEDMSVGAFKSDRLAEGTSVSTGVKSAKRRGRAADFNFDTRKVDAPAAPAPVSHDRCDDNLTADEIDDDDEDDYLLNMVLPIVGVACTCCLAACVAVSRARKVR